MATRKKPITPAQARDVSRRLRTATLGTHAGRTIKAGSSSRRHMNADAMGFSSTRRKKRVARGYVGNVLPVPENGSFARRTTRKEFARSVQRRSRARTAVAVLVCALIVVAVVAVVGSTAFCASVDSKIALSSDSASEALVAPTDDASSYYVLVAADLDASDRQGLGDGPDALALVYIDEGAQSMGIVSIPANTSVSLSDGEAHRLRDAGTWDDAELIHAVSSLTGAEIAHYVRVDAQGIAELVDGMGGLDLNLAEEIDDPVAGSDYLPAGSQHLDGAQVLTLLRATNLSGGLATQAENQQAVLSSIALSFLGEGTISFFMRLDETGSAFSTDVSAKEASKLAKALRGISAEGVQGALIPGYENEMEGVAVYVVSSSDAADMLARLEEGGALEDEADAPVNVDPASFTITVRNGSGVTGSAAEIASALESYGYRVVETGNTDSYAYTETLVVYTDASFVDAAALVVGALGMGRAVDGSGFYEFDSDVLVVVGSDWAPLS